MRKGLFVFCLLACAVAPATAQVSIGIGLPHLSIGINLPVYPRLVPIPGYPVYYAPQLDSNYFFYDGMYWVFQDDGWYASSWYNGPWDFVAPEFVPEYVLRVPVRYYRQAPAYFRGWTLNAPPRWDEHWGGQWAQRRSGWDRPSRRPAPAPAPLPVYQNKYSGDRYPRVEQQQTLHNRNYRYQPRDPVVRQQREAPRVQAVPAPERRGQAPVTERGQGAAPERTQGPAPQRGKEPAAQRAREPAPQRAQEPAPQRAQERAPQRAQEAVPQRAQERAPQRAQERALERGQGPAAERGQGSGQEQGRERQDERGRDNRN